jgi:hypothetical protein
MSDVRIDQVEFRWHPTYDLSAVASSFENNGMRQWNDLLQGHAGVSRLDRTVPVAPTSAVYLTFRGDNAALILRSLDEGARVLYHQATEDRNALVARALIGPMDALTPSLAMRLAASDLRDVLMPAPGQVDSVTLPPLGTKQLWSAAAADYSLQQRAQRQPGLAPLVAAVLRDPAHPVTMLLGPEQVGLNLHESPAIYLLWALHKVIHPLLSDVDGQPLDGWKPTFSTFEAPFRGGDGRPTPRVAFRSRPMLDKTPLHEAPKVAHEHSQLSRSDLIDAAAIRLAELYEMHGDESDHIIAKVVQHTGGLAERLTAVMHNAEAGGRLGERAPRAPVTARSLLKKPVHRPAAAEAAELGQAAEVGQPGQAGQVPQVEFAPAASASGAYPGAAVTSDSSVPDPYLARLYERLRLARDPADFHHVMRWISEKAKRRHELGDDECNRVWQIMQERGWFTKEIGNLRAAPERMADLLYPLFAAMIGGTILENKLRSWHGEAPPDPLLLHAIPILSARLDPDRADRLEQCCLPYLVSPATGQAAPRSDAWNTSGAQADGDFRQEALIPALLRDLLRLPGRLPAGLAGTIIWVALLEAVALLILFRS